MRGRRNACWTMPPRVAPGSPVDLPFRAPAPVPPGRYPYRWTMVGPSGRLDDLVQVLMDKGVLRITDLPPAAQSKLLSRTQARVALGGLSRLIDDDEDGVI